jgi:predicted nucleic acid-binding protein
MTALDTNVLVALLVGSSSNHAAATKGIKNLSDALCTTPTNIGEILRLLTHHKVFEKPLKTAKAVQALADLLEQFSIRILDEDIDWWRELPAVEEEIPGLKGNEVFDARIAICLRQHGVKRIFTWDADFKKYSFLSAINLLSLKS